MVNFDWADWTQYGPGDYFWMCRNCLTQGNVTSKKECFDAYYGHTCNGGARPRRPESR